MCGSVYVWQEGQDSGHVVCSRAVVAVCWPVVVFGMRRWSTYRREEPHVLVLGDRLRQCRCAVAADCCLSGLVS